MSIPVEPHFLYSIREQSSFTWKSMICELIDNAFDADASCVRLSWPGGKVFEISDDGVGTDNLLNLLTLGGRCDHHTNNIGKYGVGAKQALIWLWGVSEISSTVMDCERQSLSVDWESIASAQIPYPSQADVIRDRVDAGTHGTRLKCLSIRTSPKMETLLPSLSNTYTPGLELGRKILTSVSKKIWEQLKPRAWPETEEEIVDTIQAAGREVSIRMGIVKKGVPNPYNHGFSFERTYRVIKESTLGAKPGLSVSRIAARISLSKEWSLSTNKDDFTEFQDELAEAIYDRCHTLMQKASEQTITHEDSQFNRELSEIITKSSKKNREKRNRGNQSGSVEPKRTGRQRRNASQSTNEDGSVEGKNDRSARTGFDIETYEDETPTFGYYDPDGNRVRLNIANTWLRDKHRNRVQDALIPVIYGIIAEHAMKSDGGKSPLLKDQIEKEFCDQWGKMVEATVENEAKK